MTPDPPHKPFWYLRRGRDRVRDDVDAELRLHLEMRARELEADGWSPDDAWREAVHRFGDIEATREYCRRQDLEKEATVQRAQRNADVLPEIVEQQCTLRRSPALTLTVLITVGLGIAATTVIFSAVDAALLRPLPYAKPDRLVWIYTDTPPFEFRFSVADYLALDEQQHQFERIAGFTGRAMAYSDRTSGAELLTGREVSWTYFRTLRIAPGAGRDFSEADGRPGSPPAVIISHGFWQRRLGARRDAIGTAIRLDGRDYRLVGVLPPRVGPLEQGQEFFIAAQFSTPSRRGPFWYWMIGRLRDGVDRSSAQNELHAINRRLFPIWKKSYQDEKATWSLKDLKTRLVGDSRTTALLALAAVALVWLIACANASNLLIARISSRRRELAVRSALGASRARIIRHLLVESALLAFGAAALGGMLAWMGREFLLSRLADYFPRTQEIAFDGPVVAVLIGVTLISGLIFGLIPAMHGTRGSIDESIRASSRSTTGNVANRRLRQLLVGGQFAISTPLLVVAGLLLVSLNALMKVDLGFDGRNLITASVQLPVAKYQTGERAESFWSELQRRLAAVPGVSGVAFTDSRPPDDAQNINNFDLETPPPSGAAQAASTPWVAVTPEYFGVLGVKRLEGRLLDERDAQAENLLSVVVDRAWAQRFFPDGRAIGARFKEGGCTECPWTTVVGIVSDVKYVGLSRSSEGTVYWPMAGEKSRIVVMRTEGDPRTALPSVRRIVRAMDPDVPFTGASTIDDLVAASLDSPRSLSLLVAGFAAVALVLSAVGIYGLMAFYVGQHTKEISIRLALGGAATDVLKLVVGHGLTIVAGGVLIGLMAALATTRLIAKLLFGVSAFDAFTFVAVAAFLFGVALLACVVPASRAVRVQPAEILRNE